MLPIDLSWFDREKKKQNKNLRNEHEHGIWMTQWKYLLHNWFIQSVWSSLFAICQTFAVCANVYYLIQRIINCEKLKKMFFRSKYIRHDDDYYLRIPYSCQMRSLANRIIFLFSSRFQFRLPFSKMWETRGRRRREMTITKMPDLLLKKIK